MKKKKRNTRIKNAVDLDQVKLDWEGSNAYAVSSLLSGASKKKKFKLLV